MALPEEKIIKIVDTTIHSRGVSVEQVGSLGALITKIISTPVDTDKNGSLVLGYTDGNLTSLTKTIGSVSYVKTLSYTDGALTNVSVWSEV